MNMRNSVLRANFDCSKSKKYLQLYICEDTVNTPLSRNNGGRITNTDNCQVCLISGVIRVRSSTFMADLSNGNMVR